MAKKLSSKLKIVIAVIVAVLLCISSAFVLRFAFLNQDNLVFKGHSVNVSLNKERKKYYHIGLSSAVADDKPYVNDDEAMFYLKQLVYNSLIQIKNDGSVKYINASKIIFKNSGMEAEVVVDKNMRFSNGEGISADNVLSSYKWFMKNETDYSSLLSNVLSIEKENEKTLLFKFKEADLDNIKIFDIPVVLFDDSSKLALGTGGYAVSSLVFYGDVTLIKNDFSSVNMKYEKVVLSPVNYKAIGSLNENQEFDVFIFNKETQADLVKESKAYNIFEIGQDRGDYLIYNIENPDVRNALSNLVSGEDFFNETHDSGAYAKGLTSAFSDKPYYHSLIKRGSFGDVNKLSVAYDFDGTANSIYSALSESLDSLGIKCVAENVAVSEAEKRIQSDIIIYNGSLGDVVNSADTKDYFDNYKEINVKNFNKKIEKHFAKKNKITPLSKDTVWYASLAGRDDLGLFD